MKKPLTILSVLFLAFVLVACSGNNTPQAVAKKFTESIYNAEADDVLKLIYFPSDKKKEGMEDVARGKMKMMMQAARKAAKEKGGVDSISTGKPSYSDDKKQATVETTIKFKNGKEEKTKMQLVLTDDGWKMKL